MATVSFKRGDTATLNSTPITDGMIYFNLENKHIYMDNGSDRLEYYNDMVSFMDNSDIEDLVHRESPLLVQPDKMNRILGNSYIGGETILGAIDDLYEGKSLFKVVWEDDNPSAFDTKTITIDGTYAFFIILLDEHDVGYVLAQNNTVIYDHFGYYNIQSDLVDVRTITESRKISISSNSTNTTIVFGGYGIYKNGECASHSSIYKSVPYKIIGINY